MKLIPVDHAVRGDILQMLSDVIIANSFDLFMLATGLASYLFLFSARNRWKAMHGSNKQWHVQHKEKMLDPNPSTTPKYNQQQYETLLSMHVANHEHAKAQCLIASMQEEDVALGEEAMNSALTKCICSEDTRMASLLESLGLGNFRTDSTYSLLIKALSASHHQARDIVEEVFDRPAGSVFSFDLVMSILGFCRISCLDRPTVDDLLERINTTDVDVLCEFIHFYVDSNQFEKACDVFELNFATFFENELGEDTERRLLQAALKCGRLSVASHLFETSQWNAARHVVTIQRWWKRASRGIPKGSREREVGEIFGRLAHVFNERFPFEEESDADSSDESTVFLGDDDDHDCADDSDFDSDYDENNWSCDY